MLRAIQVLAVLAVFLLPPPARSFQFQSRFLSHVSLTADSTASKPAEIYWRPIEASADQPNSLFGALYQLGKMSEDDKLLRSRGYFRSFFFEYKSFSYERDYFNVYKGFTLRKFWDGAFDVGLYKHNIEQGYLFGPVGSVPLRNRLELTIHWNIDKQ